MGFHALNHSYKCTLNHSYKCFQLLKVEVLLWLSQWVCCRCLFECWGVLYNCLPPWWFRWAWSLPERIHLLEASPLWIPIIKHRQESLFIKATLSAWSFIENEILLWEQTVHCFILSLVHWDLCTNQNNTFYRHYSGLLGFFSIKLLPHSAGSLCCFHCRCEHRAMREATELPHVGFLSALFSILKNLPFHTSSVVIPGELPHIFCCCCSLLHTKHFHQYLK